MISGQRCLVTGGAGTIGSTIVDQLVAAGAAEVTVLDNLVRGRPANLSGARAAGNVRLIEGDIRDRQLVTRLMAGIDLVFHQAVAAEFPTPEWHHPYANDTLYGAAKTFNEGLLRSFHQMRGLDYVALRYFNVYGPRMDIHGLYTEVLIRWMERISAGQPPLILGDGGQTMDFVFTADIARANLLAAGSEATDEVFNTGSGTETSLAELAGTMLRVMGSDLSPEFGPPRGVNSVTRRLADVSAAASRLGWKPEVTLADGIARLVSWWRAQRQADGQR